MIIRKATPEEAEQCWLIRNRAIRHGCQQSFDPQTIRNWTPDDMPEGWVEFIANNPFFVVESHGSGPVATGCLDISKGTVEAIFTLPEFGGLGYASQLLMKVKQEARNRGLAQLTLLATPNARDFYVKHGFNVVYETLHFSSLANAEMRCFFMEAEIQPDV